MSTYIIGDIHGMHAKFLELLDLINYEPEKDTLIQLGDMIDRGPDGVDTIKWFMDHPNNTYVLMGNHELMMLEYFNGKSDREMMKALENWYLNGGHDTLLGLQKLSDSEAVEVLNWVAGLPTAIAMATEDNGVTRHWHFVHGWYSETKDMYERLWGRPTPTSTHGLEDVTVVVGHTPTYLLETNGDLAKAEKLVTELAEAGDHVKIFYGPDNTWINLDCGSGRQSGYPAVRLAAIKIDTMEEYYV